MHVDSNRPVLNEYARTLIRVKARRMIGHHGLSRSDQDDVEQELTLHLLSQAHQFDPARGSLNTFVARVVESAAAMLIRERKRLKRVPGYGMTLQSLEITIDQPDGPPTRLGTTITAADLDRRTGTFTLSESTIREQSEAIDHAMQSLSPDLQELCRQLMRHNRTGSARELGLSRRKLDAAIASIRKHFEKAGLAEFDR